MTKSTVEMTVSCEKHGKKPWTGFCICNACDRIYKVFGAGSNAPEFCECGERFKPDDKGSEFTARIICNTCARERMA